MSNAHGIYTSHERQKLGKCQRLLVNMQNSEIATFAMEFGYDSNEHKQGWALWETAAGAKRPLNHFLSHQLLEKSQGEISSTKRLINELDEFENKWFPITRRTLARFVEAPHKEVFLEGFFQDMPQVPRGPMVVGSVTKFMQRLADLKTNKTPGASKAYESLVRKGLNEKLQKAIQGILKEAGQVSKTTLASTPVSVEELEKAEKAQLQAYEELMLWYQDWFTVFRSSLPYRMQRSLGLISHNNRKTNEKKEGADSES
jgi:hypothetical protein